MSIYTLIDSITSTPTGSTHPKITLPRRGVIQNNMTSTLTFTCDAPSAFFTLNTGTSNGNLMNSLSRTELRQRYTSTASAADAALLVGGADSLYNLNFAIASVGYLAKDQVLANAGTVTGTLDAAVIKTATFTVTDSGDAARTPQDNGGDAKTLTYTVADVDGTMTLTSIKINNLLRDYSAGDKLLFAIEGQGGAVTVSVVIDAADLTSHNELTTLYVNTGGTNTAKYQQSTLASVSLTATETHTYNFSLTSVITAELLVKLLSGETSNFEISTFKSANSSSDKTFIVLN